MPRDEGGGEAARCVCPEGSVSRCTQGPYEGSRPRWSTPPRAAMSPDVGRWLRPGFAIPFLVRRARRGWLMRNCSTPDAKEGRAPPMGELPPKAAVSRRVFRWSPSHGGGISSLLVQLRRAACGRYCAVIMALPRTSRPPLPRARAPNCYLDRVQAEGVDRCTIYLVRRSAAPRPEASAPRARPANAPPSGAR